MKRARTSNSAIAHTSPMLWTSNPLEPTGPGNAPSLTLICGVDIGERQRIVRLAVGADRGLDGVRKAPDAVVVVVHVSAVIRLVTQPPVV